jgi:hypothetical protein
MTIPLARDGLRVRPITAVRQGIHSAPDCDAMHACSVTEGLIDPQAVEDYAQEVRYAMLPHKW